MKGKTSMVVWVILAAAVGIALGYIPMPQLAGSAAGTGTVAGTTIVTAATSLSAGAINSETGATLDVNGVVVADGGTWRSAEVQVNELAESLSTSAPSSLTGKAYFGNDANQGTDRGTEIYYKEVPVSYRNTVSYRIPDRDGAANIKLYPEGTVTWTGYEDNTAESTLNVSVGSGATVTSVALKIAASANAYLGNPDFNPYPLAVCFNTSSNTKWDKIAPASYVSKISPPKWMHGSNVLGDCYVLPTPALKNYGTYTFDIVLDAATGQDPVAGDEAYAFLLDKAWYYDDTGAFKVGWGDDSEEGTSYDIGIDASGDTNYKRFYFS